MAKGAADSQLIDIKAVLTIGTMKNIAGSWSYRRGTPSTVLSHSSSGADVVGNFQQVAVLCERGKRLK